MKALWKKTKQRYMSRRGSNIDQNGGEFLDFYQDSPDSSTVRPEPSDLIQLGLWDGYDWDFDLNDYELIDYYLRTFFWVRW